MGTHFMVKEKTTQQKGMIVVSDSFDQAFCDPYKKWRQAWHTRILSNVFIILCDVKSYKIKR